MNIRSVDSVGVNKNPNYYRQTKNHVSFKSETGDALKNAYSKLSLKEKLALGGLVLTTAPTVIGKMAYDSAKETASKANEKYQQAKAEVADRVERYIDKKVTNFIDKYIK